MNQLLEIEALVDLASNKLRNMETECAATKDELRQFLDLATSRIAHLKYLETIKPKV